ncbi:acetyl-CoA synthetase-like protein [Penicillium manginii]|uniref:acetyl-CoA synthetase-like protein n=1 Tax=Penicillium manginii TaxID=203109 RepID=UPI0025473BCE|nr:acetyl-CoA synthetase-like protein [Penicillium manginii]KAJ5742341.1 acetyl-CoA synthetase-like protein [Penicillium manginii]
MERSWSAEEECKSCIFPVLDGDTSNEPHVVSQDITIYSLQKIRAFCDSNGTDLTSLLIAAWSIVLHRFSEMDVLYFSLNLSGATIGMTTCVPDSVQLLAVTVNPDSPIRELLQCNSSLYALDLDSSRIHFNTGVEIRKNSTGGPLQLKLNDRVSVIDGQAQRYDLLLVMEICGEKVHMQLEYSTSALSHRQGRGIAGSVAEAIQCFFRDPGQIVRDVDLVDQQSRHDISKWNSRNMATSYHRSITEIIHGRSCAQSDAQAICSWDGQMTYAQLEKLSTILAVHLQKAGIGADVMVPLCFEKSIWAIVAILAVLKAGAAFVPMDASNPVARLQQVISQTHATFILVSEQYTTLLTGAADHILTISGSLMGQLQDTGPLAHTHAQPHHIAYVLFTSGSTGNPKGCVVEHQALGGIVSHGKALQISSGCRALQFASYSFGISLVEIFCTLVAGGVVCIPSETERINDPSGAVRRMSVDWAFLTPSVVNFLNPKSMPTLRTLAVAGEPLSKRIVENWAGAVHLVPVYGMTEWAGICTVQPQMTPTMNVQNIGTSPSANLWLVNPDNYELLAPIGAIAELLIEGPCLARGYLGDAERTTTAFITDPSWLHFFRHNGPSTLYRTGDLVRYGPDGTINYVGRKGLRTKIRGQRVELGEVEYHVCRHFRDAAKAIVEVVVPVGGTASPVLVAFVSSREGKAREHQHIHGDSGPGLILDDSDQAFRLNAATTDSAIRSLLPDYMVPQAYIPLKYVPLTVTGKVSRRTLREAAGKLSYEALISFTDTRIKKEKPGSDVEKFLHQLVSQTLSLRSDSFGVNESFFRLGGDSIRAMDLAARCRAHDISITVQDIFREKTIARLSLCANTDETSTPTQFNDNTEAAFLLSPAQQNIIHAVSRGQCQPIQTICLQMERQTSPEFMETTIYEVVRRHSMLRARFAQDDEGYWTQRVVDEPRGAYGYSNRTATSKEAVSDITATAQRVLDIKNGPVFAALYIRDDGGSQFLVLFAHELVVDQTSWKIILADIEDLLSGKNPSDRPKAQPFREWCCTELQNNRAHHVVSRQAMASKVADSAVDDSLATHKCRATGSDFTIPPTVSHSILTKASGILRVEPFEIFQALVLHSFARTFESRELPAIKAQIDGRELYHCSGGDYSWTVGHFNTHLHVKVPSHGQPDLLDFLRQTKESCRQDHNRGDTPPSVNGAAVLSRKKPIILFTFATPTQRRGACGSTLWQQVSFQAGEWPGYIHNVLPPAFTAVNVCLINDLLEVSFSRSDALPDTELQRWAHECEQSVDEVVEIIRQGKPIFIPRDFPLLEISVADLDYLLNHRLPAIGLDQKDLETAYPCSPIQQGMLLSQARQPQSYQLFFIWEVTAVGNTHKIDSDRLQAAWVQLTHRHSVLRSIFMESVSKHSFIQVVLNAGAVQTALIRCADADACGSLYANRQISKQRRETLPRFTVCETDSDRVLCALEISHVLTDATSMAILQRDLTLAYDDQLPICGRASYGDYIAFLQSACEAPAVEYWRKYLGGCGPCVFPRLRNASLSSGDTIELQHTHVPLGDVSRIHDFCADTGFTVSNVLQLAWGLVLRAFTGLNSVCFGYLASGRGTPVSRIEDAVGPYINMLICRLDFNEFRTPLQILSKLQVDFAAGLTYQHFSLSDLFHSMDLAEKSMFNTCMTFFSEESQGNDLGEGSLAILEMESYLPSEYDVMIECRTKGRRLTAALRYETATVSERQATEIAHNLYQAVSGIMEGEEIARVSLLSELDQKRLREWNGEVPERVERCVHELIEERCRAQPTAPAVCAWDGDLTYGELDALSSALAAHLVERGVGPEVFVPLCFEKSRWTTVAMLGVVKAGGAFVLLDPSYPQARLRKICRDVSAELVVASVHNRAMAADLAAQVVVVGDHETVWRKHIINWAGSAVAPDNALYAVFTSGSTGSPKGAVIPHSAYSTSALSHGQRLSLSSRSRVLQFVSYGFDVSIADSLTTLIFGASICVPSDTERRNDLALTITNYQVNWAHLTPSLIKILEPEAVPNLQTLALIGEQMSKADVEVWASRVQLINSYGPAECSVVSTILSSMKPGTDPQNIGYATDCVAWVADMQSHERLVPIGAVGELLIEGPIVGRGYLNDPERTKAVFIDPPAWLRQFRGRNVTGRLYKTGDLVQYVEDGSLRFVGRKDTQVKLRGQRIELGEVEHHVQQCFPRVCDVVAEIVTPTEAERPPLLVVFIQTDRLHQESPGNAASNSNIEDILAAPTNAFRADIPTAKANLYNVVPAYMVPELFLPLIAVPLTATGKIDRHRLRDRAAGLSRAEIEAYHSLTRLWAQVLNIAPQTIGADDNFFHLGGDSISAMKLIGVVREGGLALTVVDVFHQPRLSDLARVAQSTSGTPSHISNLPSPFSLLERGGVHDAVVQLAIDQCQVCRGQITDIYPCTALQEGLIALTAKTARAYIAHFSYRIPTDTELVHFRAAWNTVAIANPILSTRIISRDPLGSFQAVVPGELPWVLYDDEETYLAKATSSFGLGEPLVQAVVVTNRSSKKGPRFILTMHHALYDAWSLPLLLVQAAAAIRGDLLKPRPFSPFIAYLCDSKTKADADVFWRSKFTELEASCFPPLPTPAYTPNPTMSATHTISLPHGPVDGFTVSTKLRLAWALTLSQYSNTSDIVFGLTVTGRGAPVSGIEQMTGPTIATVPLRVWLDRDATITQALQRVQDQSIEMMAFEQTGLQNIRRLSDEAAAACRFQNLLVIQPRQRDDIPDLFTEPDILAEQDAFMTYALTILCESESGSVSVQATYDPQTITTTEVQRMLYQLAHMMGHIYQQPNKLIGDLSKISREDWRQLKEWNGEVPERMERCVHELIEERCRAQPMAPAVCAWDGDLTYGELDALSSALAAHLVERGVGPEVFVPLCFEKSRWTTVAMLGVVKAGGAFVLLDPSYPQARLRKICRDVSAELIIASAHNKAMAAHLVADRLVTVVSVGVSDTTWRDRSSLIVPSSVSPVNALYAVFTSGSTGTPKGLVIPHASFCSSVLPYMDALRLTSQSHILQFSSYAFDISIMDVFMSLIAGACVCMPFESSRQTDINAAIGAYQISCANITPSLLSTLTHESLQVLQTVAVGGETVSAAAMKSCSPHVQLINAYGPAECSVSATVQTRLNERSDRGNIGHAIGCACWVVDCESHERLVPIGAVGELLIEGPIVGRGYLNDPERTKAVFIDPPAWLRQFRGRNVSGRLYKTGDLVQYAEDGSLRFIGRRDTQVKLRGQRIELGEVEHHVQQCFPQARNVVAEIVTSAEAGRPPLLVVFVQTDRLHQESPGNAASNSNIEDILAAPTNAFRADIPTAKANLYNVVPAYMVPELFLPLIAVPLTATGKIDRRQLRDRAASLSRAEIEAYHSLTVAKRPPATLMERTLQQLWAQVLNTRPHTIGADDNFFHLGGDSIAAMKLISVTRKGGLALTVADVFRLPTLAQQAASKLSDCSRV